MSEAALEKIVLVLQPELALGAAINAAACLTAGLIAHHKEQAGQPLTDADGLQSVAISHLPIVALKGNDEVFQRILQSLLREPVVGMLSIFPAYARTIHQPQQYWQLHAEHQHLKEPLLGLALCGPTKWLNKLTGNLPLLR